eukprot:m.153719 g.153719  ORF g.153719 m.153719 type:complete len:79 (+) comp15071_c0_seq4:6152-6388(+)
MQDCLLSSRVNGVPHSWHAATDLCASLLRSVVLACGRGTVPSIGTFVGKDMLKDLLVAQISISPLHYLSVQKIQQSVQ